VGLTTGFGKGPGVPPPRKPPTKAFVFPCCLAGEENGRTELLK
jgi:hypothetical protein